MKGVKDPRAELKKLAKGSLDTGREGVLKRAILDFLAHEPVVLVISQDPQGAEATAHASPAAARREIVYCMLDLAEDTLRHHDEARHEFLELAARGLFQAAIDRWNEEAREMGVDGFYFDTHYGKVEDGHSVKWLKNEAARMLRDEEKAGKYKPTRTNTGRRCSASIVDEWPGILGTVHSCYEPEGHLGEHRSFHGRTWS